MHEAFAKPLSRRHFLAAGFSLAGAGGSALQAFATTPHRHQPASFNFAGLESRAGLMAAAPYASPRDTLPKALSQLSRAQWQGIKFLPSRALRSGARSPYRVELYQRGGPYQRAMTINTMRNDLVIPAPYAPDMFDFGGRPKPGQLPINFGFAGFRLMGPLSAPGHLDELMTFLGSSQFRFFGRNQASGPACRGLGAPDASDKQDEPYFREVWIAASDADADHASVLALLDGPEATGAFQFDIYPGNISTTLVTATLFARKTDAKFGLGALVSQFVSGENDQRVRDAYRPEVHQSDGLLIHNQSGEYMWRPLHNPAERLVSSFAATGVKGFGLMQRDRHFSHYQSISQTYERCPSYWVEPVAGFGAGWIQLVEMPTPNDVGHNIAASFVPDTPPLPGQPLRLRYRISATGNQPHLSPGGRAINSFIMPLPTPPQQAGKTVWRVMVDFADGDVAWFAEDARAIKINTAATGAEILHADGEANPALAGYRAKVDLAVPAGTSVDVRIFLAAEARTLTETWTFPLAGAR